MATNAKKAREFLNKVRQNDAGSQLEQFKANKKALLRSSKKQRYLAYLQTVLPDLSIAEEALLTTLRCKRPASVKRPTMEAFFELMQEEMTLQQELAELYRDHHASVGYDLLSQCAEDPRVLIERPRVFEAKEYELFQRLLNDLRLEAQNLQAGMQTVLRADLPICTSTFDLFTSLDPKAQLVSTDGPTDLMLWQVGELAYKHSLATSEKQNDLYAEAFQIPIQKVDKMTAAFADKARINKEVAALFQSLQQRLLWLNQLLETPVSDEQLDAAMAEVSVLASDALQEKLNRSAATALPNLTRQRPDTRTPAELKRAQPSLQFDEEAIKRKATMEALQQAEQTAQKYNDLVEDGKVAATQAYRMQLNRLQDIKQGQKASSQQAMRQMKIEAQRKRMEAAEKDAAKYRPAAPDDPERIYRETSILAHRKAQRETFQQLKGQLARGTLDMQFQGEAVTGRGFQGANKALSFEIMQKLADAGALGTAAAKEALQTVRSGELQARFPAWALAEGVRKIFEPQ